MRLIGRILLYFLAAIGGLVVLAVVASVVLVIRFREPTVELPGSVVLWFDLNRGIVEGPPRRLLPDIGGRREIVLRDAIEALDAASRDDRVKGLAVRIGNRGLSLTHAQELRDAIADFRAAGKFAEVFAESFGGLGNGTVEYSLATAFERIWLQPSGEVGLIGIGIEMPFLGDALDKLDIETRVEQRQEYKSAPEVFTRNGLSEPARRSLQRLVDSWLEGIVRNIAQDRGLEPTAVRRLVDTGPHLAEEAKRRRLVDRLGYWDEFRKAVETRVGENTEWVAPAAYLEAAGRPNAAGPRVALIYGVGPIVSGRGRDTPFSPTRRFGADAVAEAIARATEDDSINAILFRVDSPGGSYIASDMVWREIERAREAGKPVVASMGRFAASGGYFVAMAADKVIAAPGTVTGSIGVYGGKLVTQAFWERLGIRWDGVEAGARARMWSQIRDYPAGAETRVSDMLDRIYEDFTTKAAAARGLSAQQLDMVARGRVWSGVDAREKGLVDELGGFAAGVDAVKAALGLKPTEPINLVVLPRPLTPVEQVIETLQEGGLEAGTLLALLFDGTDGLAAGVVDDLGSVIGVLEAMRPVGVLQIPPFRLAR
jgi:protease-4